MKNKNHNVAKRLVEMAGQFPEKIAIAVPREHDTNGRRRYETITFREFDAYTDKIAQALIDDGVRPGMRLALMTRHGIDFIAMVYAIFKTGAAIVMVDPGMGMRRMLNCLAEAEPDGFVSLPAVHAVRCLLRHKFPKAKHNLTVGKRWFWGGLSLEKIKRQGHRGTVLVEVEPDTPTAIIFTSGSTGIPKGVLYTHRIVDTQVGEIAARLDIQAEIADVAGFPFFGLFDPAMGVTMIIPDMNPTRPADVKPENILEAIADWNALQSFGSPALWHRVANHCIERGIVIESLKRIALAGAPISVHLLSKLKKCLTADAKIFTPYGATESLPVAVIEANEVLNETAALTNLGQGICVGKRFSQIEWRVIKITDDPIERLEDAEEMPTGEIGELVVTGPQVTQRYVTRVEANALAKMTDSQGRIWHRIGDVGRLDTQERFWFCGRKTHRLETVDGPMYTIPCEAIFNMHPHVYRSALAGSGEFGQQTPVMYVEPRADCFPESDATKLQMTQELLALGKANPLTERIETIRFLKAFPVDVRHNAKINRELMTEWETGRQE